MSTDDQPILRHSRLSRAEALAREIEEEISAGVVTTGDRLGTKDDLRRRFGVAAATVNEAVKLLETRGLAGARPGPGGGVFVASPAERMRGGPMLRRPRRPAWIAAAAPPWCAAVTRAIR